MKIGIITNLYPPYGRGGAENIIVRTVNELLALGHDVFVITGQPKKKGRKVTVDRSSTERIYRFFPDNLYFTLDDYRYRWPVRLLWHIIDALGLRSTFMVRDIVLDERPEVVITHNLKGIGLSIPRMLRAWRIPHVHVLHDVQLLYPSGLLMFGHEKLRWFEQPFYFAYRSICRFKLGNPDLVISPSHYLERTYRTAGFFKDSTVAVLHNPAPVYDVMPRTTRAAGPLRLLFVGQLAHHKGIPFLLEALTHLPAETKLFIAGDGPLRKMVEQVAEKNKQVTYLGFTQQEELIKVFTVVDAVVVPSLCYENSPTVIYESLQAGVPVIASRIGGVGELLIDGVTGYLFTPGDMADFVRAVHCADKEKESTVQVYDAIRATVADYAPKKYTARLVQELETVVKKRGDSGLPLS